MNFITISPYLTITEDALAKEGIPSSITHKASEEVLIQGTLGIIGKLTLPGTSEQQTALY